MTVETMLYRRYKQHFSDGQTVAGSYDKNCKTMMSYCLKDAWIVYGTFKPSCPERIESFSHLLLRHISKAYIL